MEISFYFTWRCQKWKIKIAAASVSTHDQEEYSPKVKLLIEITQNNGFILPEEFIFRDDGISGRRADKAESNADF
ncbi:MAG: hypothetical protein ACLVJZ_09805 [[Clostridium] leptum]